MSWFLFALLAPLLWAIVNLIDDNLLRNVYRSATFGAVISGLFGAIPAFYLYVTNESLDTEPKYIASAVLAGFLTVIFYYFYFRTLAAEEPSVALALYTLAPAIVPILALTFLNETLNTKQYLGIAVIIGAALLLSMVETRKFKLSTAIIFAFFGSLAFAVGSVFSKYAYQGGSFREIYLWIAVGLGIGGLSFFFFSNRRQEIKRIVKRSKKKILAILVLAEIINIAAEVVQGYAISGGPVSVVRAMEGIQPIYILLIGLLLSPVFPKAFRETFDKRLPRKIILMFVMLAGLGLIYSGI